MTVDYLGALQAILAVPSAIHSLREMFSNGHPKKEDIDKTICQLSSSLITFSSLHGWLLEAKELHDKVSIVVSSMDRINVLTNRVMRNNRFELNLFDYDEFELTWRAIRNSHINMLISYMKNLKTFADDRLVMDEDTQVPTSGRGDFKRIVLHVAKVDEALDSYRPEIFESYAVIVKSVRIFNSQLQRLLFDVNAEIRTRAEELANRLQQLNGGLQDV